MLEKLDSQVSCKIPKVGTRPQFEAKKGFDHRSKIEHCTVSQSVSMSERNRKDWLPELLWVILGKRFVLLLQLDKSELKRLRVLSEEMPNQITSAKLRR